MADVAFTFHFPLSEIMSMDVSDLLQWHSQIVRIRRVVTS